MLSQYGNLNQASSKLNIYIFLRIQQNACSSDVELIKFGSAYHWNKEFIYIDNILKPLNGNFILTSNEPESLEINFLTSSIVIKVFNLCTLPSSIRGNNIVCILNNFDDNCREWLTKFIDQCLSVNIFLIRHEGDFPINGINIDCDCNNCLSNSIFKALGFIGVNELLKFINVSEFDYQNGYQYSLLSYKLNLINNNYTNNLDSYYNINSYEALINHKSVTQNSNQICKKQRSKAITIIYPSIIQRSTNNDAYIKYQEIGSPKHIAAPMIGQSELAFRMMVRKYGVELCYTPMINAEIFVNNLEYQQELFTTTDSDRPLIAQFAANDPETLLAAAKQVASKCDYIDINLGCPQPIARRHYYGAWLMEDPNTIYKLIKYLVLNLSTPISCKIRIFECIEQTIQYAQMLEKAGCSLLTIHARERKSSMNSEPANWEYAKEIKKHLNIPVIVNGSISNLEAAKECLALTECDGVMAASHLLANPCLFTNEVINIKNLALEYLDFACQYKALFRYAKAHVLQIFSGKVNEGILNEIKTQDSIQKLTDYIINLPEKGLPCNKEDKREHFQNNAFNAVEQASVGRTNAVEQVSAICRPKLEM